MNDYKLTRIAPDGSTHTWYTAKQHLKMALDQHDKHWPDSTLQIRRATTEEIQQIYMGI